MSNDSTTLFVGLDVHKDSIAVAYIGSQDDPIWLGNFGGLRRDVETIIRKLQSKAAKLSFVYEAGPTGFDLYRYLISKGHDCIVVSPTHIPKASSDRVKTDKRDALALARLHRRGDLTGIYVPDIEDESLRDLSRAREEAVDDLRRQRQRLKSFLLRHDFRYQNKADWGKTHLRYLHDEVKLATPVQQQVFQSYLFEVTRHHERLQQLEVDLHEAAEHSRWLPLIHALQALRGVQFIVAITLVAELGDLHRFAHPKQLMSYLGLTTSEYSSGATRRQGGITKCGNGHARRVLVESAWAYQFKEKINRDMQKRNEGLPLAIQEIAWKAQVRLCKRFRRLLARGVLKNKIVVAIAREISAYVWAIAQQLPPLATK